MDNVDAADCLRIAMISPSTRLFQLLKYVLGKEGGQPELRHLIVGAVDDNLRIMI